MPGKSGGGGYPSPRPQGDPFVAQNAFEARLRNPAQNPTNMYTGQPMTGYPGYPSTPVKSGGGGGGYSGPTGPSLQDRYGMIYDDLSKAITGLGNDQIAGIGASADAVRNNYRLADSDIFKQYMGARDDLTGRAGNLGVDLNTSTIGSNWDNNLRRIQEMSNSNLNSDLSYFEKMKDLRRMAFDAIQQGLQQDKLAAIQSALTGGGGSSRGGRGGGGGSSSGNPSETAKETQTYNNANDQALLQELLGSGNTGAAKAFNNAYLSAGGNSSTALTNLMANKAAVDKLMTSISKLTLGGAGKAVKNAPNKTFNPAIAAMANLAGVYAPAITRTVTTTAKRK